MTAPAYPQRPAFFAYRFCRLMAKVCLANEIGAEACWLLTVIAQTEDAKGYRSPVTFFNEQLFPLVGLNNVKALARLRDKAVASGWLHYLAGGKGRAGRYWVTVPKAYLGVDDAPSDERPEKYAAAGGEGYSGTESTQKVGREPGGKCPENREESGERSVQHSSLTLPQDKESASQSGGQGPAARPAGGESATDPPKDPPAAAPPPPTKKPRAVPDTPHHQAVAAFCEGWQARYGQKYPFNAGRDGKSVKAMLKYLDGDLERFRAAVGRYFACEDEFVTEGGHTLGIFRAQLAKWVTPRPAGRGGVGSAHRVEPEPGKYARPAGPVYTRAAAAGTPLGAGAAGAPAGDGAGGAAAVGHPPRAGPG